MSDKLSRVASFHSAFSHPWDTDCTLNVFLNFLTSQLNFDRHASFSCSEVVEAASSYFHATACNIPPFEDMLKVHYGYIQLDH